MKILVTGSSSGIGRALCTRLVGRGHNVWGLSRSAALPIVSSANGSFQTLRCDVSKWVEVESAAATVAEQWEHLDGLVACAGVQGELGRALEADPVRWSETVRVNLDGTYFAIRAFHPLMRRAPGRTKIVCMSGGGATKGRPNFSAYGAAKTAVVRLVETIALEEGPTRLDINAVAPGAINTRLTDEVIALGPSVVGKSEFEIAQRQRAEGGASMEAALDCIEWLISSRSDGVTGRLLSAPWDPWKTLGNRIDELKQSDIFTLRRVLPEDKNLTW